jgi:hypothetical protein
VVVARRLSRTLFRRLSALLRRPRPDAASRVE